MSRNSLLETGAISEQIESLSVRLRAKWLWVRVPLKSFNGQITEAKLHERKELEI